MNFITETLRADGKIWVVMVVAGVVLLGWLYYLLQMGIRVGKLETRIKRLMSGQNR